MKLLKLCLVAAVAIALLMLVACSKAGDQNTADGGANKGEVSILLSDNGVTVDGQPAGDSGAVYLANDIIYYEDRDTYESGHPYGEGTAADRHSAEEAAGHTVVHITQPGTYRISGKLSAGQIFVDLGEDAETDISAVATLILDNADITCTVAPAIFFYRTYECADREEDTRGVTDLTLAGARVILADGSENTVSGSYVARIYEDGGEEKKLHKYDAAFYSRMSLRLDGGEVGDGRLTIHAANEGLDSELHLTVDGGNIAIYAQNDGINTNEDGISVTTINDGYLYIEGGLGAEGDGIDSNGYLTVNGGTVVAYANPAADGGMDADLAITVNGGAVAAFGGMNGPAVGGNGRRVLTMTLGQQVAAGTELEIRDSQGQSVFSLMTVRPFTNLLYSGEGLTEGESYTLWADGEQLETGGMGGPGGMMPGGMAPPDFGGFGAMEVPEVLDSWLETAEIPDEIRQWIETMADMMQQRGEIPPGGGFRPDGAVPPMDEAADRQPAGPAAVN